VQEWGLRDVYELVNDSWVGKSELGLGVKDRRCLSMLKVVVICLFTIFGIGSDGVLIAPSSLQLSMPNLVMKFAMTKPASKDGPGT
jgi:hypothetical protein